MTPYEQYVSVATFVRSSFTYCPVYMVGERVKTPPPYVVLRSYGVANEGYGFDNGVRKDVKGYSAMCYGTKSGKAELLVSEFLNHFTGIQNSDKLSFEGMTNEGWINRLEDDLFEGLVSFRVSSIFKP